MKEQEKACGVPIGEQLNDLRKELNKLRDRLTQTEDVLFALCAYFELKPGQEIIKTGDAYEPFIYRGAVISKGL